MPGRAIAGQLAAVIGSGLLLIFVPFMPSVWGLPRLRVAEMGVFWLGGVLLLFGLEAVLASFIQSCRNGSLAPAARRIGVYAGVSAVVGLASCVITLSILLVSSLSGAGIIPGSSIVSHMPSFLRYAVALPLLPMFACQCLSFGMLRLPAAERSAAGRTARSLLLLLLFIAAALFAGAVLMFLANRWFAVFAVVATWLAQWMFVALAIEQTAFLVRELTSPAVPVHDVPSHDSQGW